MLLVIPELGTAPSKSVILNFSVSLKYCIVTSLPDGKYNLGLVSFGSAGI